MSAASHTSAYDPFAWIYDRWMAAEFCRRALPAIERLLLAGLPPGARVLDLCCGSGQMARALVERGFRVTGVDASAPMLECARRNAPGAEFVLADARNLHLPQRFAGALSTFNSLAHVDTVGELESVFRNLRVALLPGAAFLFDLSMEEAYTSKWRGTLGVVAESHACLLRPSYDRVQRIGRNEVTVFQRRENCFTAEDAEDAEETQGPSTPLRSARDDRAAVGEGVPRLHAKTGRSARDDNSNNHNLSNHWTRIDFCIEQKCHSERELRQALAAAGFGLVETYDAQRDLDIPGERGRMFFLCR